MAVHDVSAGLYIASDNISMTELGIINFFMLGMTYCLEFVWLLKHETRKTILFENIKLVDISQGDKLKKELERRTGLIINRVEVGKINFLDDTAQIRIFYFDDEQGFSDYNEQSE